MDDSNDNACDTCTPEGLGAAAVITQWHTERQVRAAIDLQLRIARKEAYGLQKILAVLRDQSRNPDVLA